MTLSCMESLRRSWSIGRIGEGVLEGYWHGVWARQVCGFLDNGVKVHCDGIGLPSGFLNEFPILLANCAKHGYDNYSLLLGIFTYVDT